MMAILFISLLGTCVYAHISSENNALEHEWHLDNLPTQLDECEPSCDEEIKEIT